MHVDVAVSDDVVFVKVVVIVVITAARNNSFNIFPEAAKPAFCQIIRFSATGRVSATLVDIRIGGVVLLSIVVLFWISVTRN